MADDYKDLIEKFLEGNMSPQEFQVAYLDRFEDETRTLSEPLFAILDKLFGDVEAFEADEQLLRQLQAERPGFYVDEEELRQRASEALNSIAELEKTT